MLDGVVHSGDASRPMLNWRSLRLGALVVACGLLARCQGQTEGQADPEPVRFANLNSNYVGDAACFDCHAEQWRGFQEHGMARSFYPMRPDNAVEDFAAVPLFHPGSGYHYRVLARGDSFYQVEYRLDDLGNKTHELVRRMDYVVGSGNAARTYLTESKGRLYEMPLTWYTQAAAWDFSPGYERYNKRFSRLVPDRCMACHNSYPASVPFVDGKYEEVPEGIGCERCHGPGELHVQERLESSEVQGAIDHTIVNPAHLTIDRQMDICQQCHLHTTVSLLRDGREAFDFRPSERLEDFVALYSAPQDDVPGTIDVISHAARLKQSACFVVSPMTCTTCHDPHEGFRTKGPAYFDETCISCHKDSPAQGHGGGESCSGCHMPKVPAAGAPHASFTDHWIRDPNRHLPNPVPAHELEAGALVPFFDKDSSGSTAGAYAALAALVHATQQADGMLLERAIQMAEPVHLQDPTGELSFVLGVALTNMGRGSEAIEPLRHAVAQAPVPERLNGLAQALEQSSESLGEIAALYDSALARQPALADIRVNYGVFLQRQGQLQESLQQFRLAATEAPLLVLAHTHLGTVYMQDGAFDMAEASLRRAIALEPDDADALGNLGLMYATMAGRRHDARGLFERAAEAAPLNAVAQGNLGTWYLNNEFLDEAIAHLSRAVELEPAYLGGKINLATAHARSGNYLRARRLAREVLQVDANNPTALRILAAL